VETHKFVSCEVRTPYAYKCVVGKLKRKFNNFIGSQTRDRLACSTVPQLRASVASYGHVPSSPILVTLMMVALRSSGKSILEEPHDVMIPEDVILHNNRRENHKSYIALTGWTL
jgi:hypothetical protein